MGRISWYEYEDEASEKILSSYGGKKEKLSKHAHVQPQTHVTLKGLVVSEFFLSCCSLACSRHGSTAGATAGELTCTMTLPGLLTADQALHSDTWGFP